MAKGAWQLIETCPKDENDSYLVGVCIATVWVVRLARWDSGELWESQGFENQEEARGWWSSIHSVTQEKLEGMFEPQVWAECPDGLHEMEDILDRMARDTDAKWGAGGL